MRFGTNIGSLNVINHVDYHGKSNTHRRTDDGNNAEKRILSQSVNDCLIFIGIFFLRKQHYSS